MSYPERDTSRGPASREAFERLEKAVEASVVRVKGLTTDLAAARAEARRLESQLQRFTGGEESPSKLLARLQHLEAENGLLHERLRQGREGVAKLLARIRYLQEQG